MEKNLETGNLARVFSPPPRPAFYEHLLRKSHVHRTIMMVERKEGDRVIQESGETAVITPQGENTLHNFGPASHRDSVVFTCERPGGDPPNKDSFIPTAQVIPKWIDFIKTIHSISNVLILMDEAELETAYAAPGLIQAYRDGGMTVHHVPMSSSNAANHIISILQDVESKGERVTAHCTHGMGRSGRVAAGWLMTRYGLSAEQATEEVLETARLHGIEHMGAPQKLERWLAGRS